MPGLTIKKFVQYFKNDEEKEIFILDTVDKLVPLFPDYDYFQVTKYYKILEPDIVKKRKLHSVTKYIEAILLEKEIIENVPNYNCRFKLTAKGRIAKSKGSLTKYEKSIKPKKDYLKTASFIVTIISLIITGTFLYLNYSLSLKRDKLELQNRSLQKTIDSLIKENKLKTKTAP